VERLKADLQSFKVSLGMNRMVHPDLSATFNNEPMETNTTGGSYA